MHLSRELELIVERLNEAELHDLGDFVHERLKFFHRMHDIHSLQQFRILDEVMFHHNGEYITGVVIRVNQRTVTVKTEKGTWHVSPIYLTKVREGFNGNERESITKAVVVSEENPLVGFSRNVPCPCGSGRKFKKCHGV
jgi:uncharacterized protein YecA (UPF0149 family)